jgi:hypothetical protein
VYTKEMSAFLYIPFHSAHPPAALRNFIRGEAIRFIRNCTIETDYNNAIIKLRGHLMRRSYPARLIQQQLSTVKYSDRTVLLNKQLNRDTGKRISVLPCIIPFYKQFVAIGLPKVVKTATSTKPSKLPTTVMAWNIPTTLQGKLGMQWE